MLNDPHPALVNDDIRPTEPHERTWSVLNLASLWIGMVVCVPTYRLAADLVFNGMSWGQAVMAVLIGNVIVLVPMILNGHAGTRYGIPFPVLARASFGVRGAHIPALSRALVACGWFGIQTWVGGFAIYQLLNVILGGGLASDDLPVLGINAGEVASFVAFWSIQLVIIHRGVGMIRKLATLAAPVLLVMGLALLIWAWAEVGSLSRMLSNESRLSGAALVPAFSASVTAMVGFWATLSLNIPDFTRYARSQRDQILGQALGLPLTMTLFAFIGVAVTNATAIIFGGAPVREPTRLLGMMGGGFTVVLALFALSVATLSTNIAANVVSPANAMINVNPRRISFRLAGYVTAGLGIAMFPWKLYESPDGYIFTWLIGYGALLGPIVGILIADYFVVRKRRLDVESLYRYEGAYSYTGGFNIAAILALAIGILPNLPGFLLKLKILDSIPEIFVQSYTYAIFVGFFLAATVYLLLMKIMSRRFQEI